MSIKDRIEARKAEIFTEIKGDLNKASMSLLSKIQMKSPVGAGRFNRKTGKTREGLRESWRRETKSEYHYLIYSPLPYAHVLEYGLYPNPPKKPTGKTDNGYSNQAPAGYARISIEEVKNEFK